jgi:hypothetical protein
MRIKVHNSVNELIIQDEDAKSIVYVPKTGLQIKADNGIITISDGNQSFVNTTPDNFTLPAIKSLFNLVQVLKGYIDDNPINGFSGGWGDYTDATTTGVPITLTGGAAFVSLTNDKSSVNETYLPFGVHTLWDSSTNKMSLTGMSVGDIIGIRITLSLIIATVNTEVNIILNGGIFTVPITGTRDFKTVQPYTVSQYTEFFIGDQSIITNGVYIQAKAEKTCTVIVTGWYIKAIKIGS